MKKLLMVLMVSMLAFGCEEQDLTGGGSSNSGGGSAAPVPQVPYQRGAILPISSLPVFTDSSKWRLQILGSASYTIQDSEVGYSCAASVCDLNLKSGFKIIGDMNDNNSFTLSSKVNMPANNSTNSGVFFNFGGGSTKSIISVIAYSNGSNYIYTIQYTDHTNTFITLADSVVLGSKNSAHALPVQVQRDNLGVIYLTVNGTTYQINQSSFSQDMDIEVSVNNVGVISLTDTTLTANTSFAEF